jgi:hypothetical protein
VHLQVSFYNFTQQERLARFCKGAHIAISEPFYKVMNDGSRGVRVDNPKDVTSLARIGPSDAAGTCSDNQLHHMPASRPALLVYELRVRAALMIAYDSVYTLRINSIP